MKKNILLLLFTVYSLCSAAQYKPDDAKSSVKFKIKNFGIAVGGMFSGFKGNISFDPANPQNATFKIAVNAASINTDNDLRDKHLKNQDYFDVEHYPEIYFESTRVSKTEKNGAFVVVGKMTIKNHSKEISFPFTAQPSGNGYLFQAVFTINRKDFDVGGSSIISDTAEVTLEVTAVK